MTPLLMTRIRDQIADQIRQSIAYVSKKYDSEDFYSIALVLTGDLSYVMMSFNTESHYRKSCEKLDTETEFDRSQLRWGQENWWGAGDEVEAGFLLELLRSANDNDETAAVLAFRTALGIWLLASALRAVADENGLVVRGRRLTAFCTLTGSADYDVAELETAKALNSDAAYATYVVESAAYHDSWVVRAKTELSLTAIYLRRFAG